MNKKSPEPVFARFKNVDFFGFIIKKKEFGEGNRFFTLIEKRLGKIDIMSFGSGKAKSRKRSALLTGNLIGGIMTRSSEEKAYAIKEVAVKNSFYSIKSDLRAQSYAFLIFEIIDVILGKENYFNNFSLLIATLEKINSNTSNQIEKYALYFLVKILWSEGIFPAPDPSIIKTIKSFTKETFSLGNGSYRFLSDSYGIDNIDFLDPKEISDAVIRNLLELISIVVLYHFDRKLNSPALIL